MAGKVTQDPAQQDAPDDAEERLAALLKEHAEPRFWLHRRPREAREVHRLLGRLPVVPFSVSDAPEGRVIATMVAGGLLGMRTRFHEAASVLELPTEPGTYNVGRARATQRRKARAAAKAGVTCRQVPPEERPEVLAHANRFHGKQTDNSDLLDVDLWIAAYQDGTPIALAVIPVDGDWSILRYFRRIDEAEAASDARYLLTEAVAEEAARRGARHLVDTVSPLKLPQGIMHFARMVGFRVVRLRTS